MRQLKYLIRKRALGDVLWIEPVIRQLALKHRKIIVHTKYNELFKNYPLKNVIFKNKLSIIEKCIIHLEGLVKTKFLTVNLDNAYESQPYLHFLHAYQKKANLPITTEYPKLYLTREEEERKLVTGKYIVLHIESFSDKIYRKIFGVNWEKVADHLQNKGFKVVQVGTQINAIKGVISLQTSVRDLISLLNSASYFIGLDSGPSHIAASLGIPSIIFFGAYQPDTRHFRELFKGELIKQPCEYDNDYASIVKGIPTLCHQSNNPEVAICCLYTTENVLKRIEYLLDKFGNSKV